MKVYPESYIVSVDVALVDLNGGPVTPTAISAKLYDGDDQLVSDLGVVAFSPGDTSVTVQVPAEDNELADGVVQAARILRVDVVTAAGTLHKSTSYIVAGQVRLQVMVNSFQTLENAELLARDMVGGSGWGQGTDDQKAAALIEAFNRLTRIPMRYWTTVNDHQCERFISAADWREMTADAFLELPSGLRNALRAAQLQEADTLLADDPIARKHKDGVISETIGDSSMMLRGGKLELGVAYDTLNQLRGFIWYNFRVARA